MAHTAPWVSQKENSPHRRGPSQVVLPRSIQIIGLVRNLSFVLKLLTEANEVDSLQLNGYISYVTCVIPLNIRHCDWLWRAKLVEGCIIKDCFQHCMHHSKFKNIFQSKQYKLPVESLEGINGLRMQNLSGFVQKSLETIIQIT